MYWLMCQYETSNAPMPKPVGLTTTQRNIYQYYLHHKQKYKGKACLVPELMMFQSRSNTFLRALEVLEEKQLISVERNTVHYGGWIIKDPETKPANVIENSSQ